MIRAAANTTLAAALAYEVATHTPPTLFLALAMAGYLTLRHLTPPSTRGEATPT